MKLKKIASLMLAGIMAVSMLAGCNGEPAPDPDDGNNGGVTVTGYSAVLGEELKDHKAIKGKDYITFANNNEDQAALQAAVDSVETGALEIYAAVRGVQSIGAANGQIDIGGPTGARVAEIFVNGAKITDPSEDLKPGDLAMAWYAGYNNNADNDYTDDLNTSVKDGAIFVVNGGVTTDEAVKMVAGEVADILSDEDHALPEYNKGAENESGESWKYSYVISVSVVDKAQHSNYTDDANSAHFIAVTVSRTATTA